MTVQDAIRRAALRLQTAGIETSDAQTEARLLAQFAFAFSRETLRMHPDREISPEQAAHFDALITRREKREPLAYLTGMREFYGLPFLVTPDVLIPRPETEFVVEAILGYLKNHPNARRIADVGTGSGAIAVSVAAHAPPDVRGWASDVSEGALTVARQNAQALGVADRVTFAQGDLLAPLLPFAPFDVIASNPPYIAPAEIETLAPEVRDFEPRMALGQNDDAFFFYKRLANDAPPLLVPGGLLVVEVGQGQDEAVAELWRGAGFADVLVAKDYRGIGRVVSGTKYMD